MQGKKGRGNQFAGLTTDTKSVLQSSPDGNYTGIFQCTWEVVQLTNQKPDDYSSIAG